MSKEENSDLAGGLVMNTSCFHYKGRGFHLWSAKFHVLGVVAKKRKKKNRHTYTQGKLYLRCLESAGRHY